MAKIMTNSNDRIVQVFNPRINKWVKLDTQENKILGRKVSPYKGLRRYK